MWTQEKAIKLACLVEAGCPAYGCHVALTGGCLYRDGPRKDCDLVFYRIRQVDRIDVQGLYRGLARIGFSCFVEKGFITKCLYQGEQVDLFFPEYEGGMDEEIYV